MLQLLDLPNEVLDITLSNLRQADLYSLCLVCRTTYSSARPYLYRDVTITDRRDFASTGSLNGLRSFMITIWKNPKLAEQVQSLRMRDAPVRSSASLRMARDWQTIQPYHLFPRLDNKDELDMCKTMMGLADHELSQAIADFFGPDSDPNFDGVEFMKGHLRTNSRCALLGFILNKLKVNVRTLRIDIEKNTAGTRMDPPINKLTGSREEYVNLRTCTVRGHSSPSRNNIPVLHGDGWAWMPAMKSLTLDNLIVQDLCLKRGDTFAGLEHLTITNCILNFGLDNLLTPYLRSLALENCRYAEMNFSTRAPSADNWPCKASLESLTILDSDCYPSGTFADFAQLKYLALDISWYESLRIRNGQADAPIPSMELLLPPSLVGFHFGNCFNDEFPPAARSCNRVEAQMRALLRSRNAGTHQDLEFVEVSVYGRHDGAASARGAAPKRQLKMRERLQKAFRDAGPRDNSHGQLVEIYFTMLCSCVWDCKHAVERGVAAESSLGTCWLAQEPTFKRAGVVAPAA